MFFFTFSNFNSIKVRLEPRTAREQLNELAFQFHKGTIRTWGCRRCRLRGRLFQFHKGTIRTCNEGSPLSQSY